MSLIPLRNYDNIIRQKQKLIPLDKARSFVQRKCGNSGLIHLLIYMENKIKQFPSTYEAKKDMKGLEKFIGRLSIKIEARESEDLHTQLSKIPKDLLFRLKIKLSYPQPKFLMPILKGLFKSKDFKLENFSFFYQKREIPLLLIPKLQDIENVEDLQEVAKMLDHAFEGAPPTSPDAGVEMVYSWYNEVEHASKPKLFVNESINHRVFVDKGKNQAIDIHKISFSGRTLYIMSNPAEAPVEFFQFLLRESGVTSMVYASSDYCQREEARPWIMPELQQDYIKSLKEVKINRKKEDGSKEERLLKDSELSEYLHKKVRKVFSIKDAEGNLFTLQIIEGTERFLDPETKECVECEVAFSLTDPSGKIIEERVISYIFFLNWIDRGTPRNQNSIKDTAKKMLTHRVAQTNCSAGVGRAGTLAAEWIKQIYKEITGREPNTMEKIAIHLMIKAIRSRHAIDTDKQTDFTLR